MLHANLKVNGVTVATIEVINDATGEEKFGNYDFVLTDERTRTAGVGRIEGFGREQTPWRLVYECLKQVYDRKEGIWKDRQNHEIE